MQESPLGCIQGCAGLGESAACAYVLQALGEGDGGAGACAALLLRSQAQVDALVLYAFERRYGSGGDAARRQHGDGRRAAASAGAIITCVRWRPFFGPALARLLALAARDCVDFRVKCADPSCLVVLLGPPATSHYACVSRAPTLPRATLQWGACV